MIKKCILLSFTALIAVFQLNGQSERFILEGAVTIGASASQLPPAGTMRWNSTTKDFEGFNGSEWLSLTSGAAQFGEVNPYRYESLILTKEDGIINESFGEDVAVEGDYYAVGIPHTNNGQGAVFLYDDGVLINKITNPGSQEFGERVDISGPWMAIGADDNNAYVYNLIQDDLQQLKLQSQTALSEFIKIDGELLAVKGVDSTIYTFLESGGQWNELGQVSNKEVPSSAFDISEVGHLAINELTNLDVTTYRFQNNAWQEKQTISPPSGFRSGGVSLYGNSMAISYNWLVPSPLPSTQVIPEQGFIKVFIWQNNTWTEQATIEVPNAYFLGSPKIHGNTIITGSDVLGSDSNQVLHNGQGKVHIIQQAGNSWEYKYTLTSSDGRAGDIFGQDYDLGENGIIVGAIWADLFIETTLESVNQGKAYIFKK